MAQRKNLPWTPARRHAAPLGKQDSVQSFASSSEKHRGPPSSAPSASQSLARSLVRVSSAPGMSRATAVRRLGTPGQSVQSAGSRASASDARLKKGLGNLKPLPPIPLTFEDMFQKAKRRAALRSAEERHRSINNGSTRSWSATSGSRSRAALGQAGHARNAWGEAKLKADKAFLADAAWAQSALEGIATGGAATDQEGADAAMESNVAMTRQSSESDKAQAENSGSNAESNEDGDGLPFRETKSDLQKATALLVKAHANKGKVASKSAKVSNHLIGGLAKQRGDVVSYLTKIRRSISNVGGNQGSKIGSFSSKSYDEIHPSKQLHKRCSVLAKSSAPKNLPDGGWRESVFGFGPRASTRGKKPTLTGGESKPRKIPAVFEGDSRLNVESIKTRAHADVFGFDEHEYARMRTTYRRFADPQSNDVHIDDLAQIFSHLGYLRTKPEQTKKFAEQVCPYSTLDFAEFVQVAERCAQWEHTQFQEIFNMYDSDKSGELSTDEIIDLITSLGITPLRHVLEEAISVVDLDGSGLLDFDEFVYLMAVYRVTEGFTRDEVELLLHVFERFSHTVGSGDEMREELESGQLGQALLHMFGPQSIDLARNLAKKYKITLTEGCETLGQSHTTSMWSEGTRDSVVQVATVKARSTTLENLMNHQQGLSFQEFLVWARQLREAEVLEYRKQFDKFDFNRDGLLSIDELVAVINALGYTPLKEVIQEVIGEVDADHDEELDFDEFVNLMAIFRTTDGFCQHEMEEFYEVFTKYDVDESQEVNCLELVDILRYLGYLTRLEDVRRYIEQVDFNGSGSLDFREFIHLMRLHREEELRKVKKVFDGHKDMNSADMHINKVRYALKELGYKLKDEELAKVLAEFENPAKFDFDIFASMVDQSRKAHAASRRRRAGFSDEEIKHFQELFEKYDEDSNKYIERHELTKLLKDLHIEMRTVQEREVLLQKIDRARQDALTAGVSQDLVCNFGDPKVTFYTLVHFIRLMHKEDDKTEVDRDMEATIQSKFTAKQVAEFREIFGYWAQQIKEVESNSKPNPDSRKSHSASPNAEVLRKRHGEIGKEDDSPIQYLPIEGLYRLLKSLGLQISNSEKELLEARVKNCDLDSNDRIDFPNFLRIMRWLMDSNFANINYAVGHSGDSY